MVIRTHIKKLTSFLDRHENTIMTAIPIVTIIFAVVFAVVIWVVYC